jgi:hypothetical protein
MTCQDNEILLNNVLIQMSRSFLQYVAESSPWVRAEVSSLDNQIQVLAERQRQSVGRIVELLTAREHFIDFGSFPTEYTDLQFLSLQTLIKGLKAGQQKICRQIGTAVESLRTAGDAEGAEVLAQVHIFEQDTLQALGEISVELEKPQQPVAP